VCVIAKSYFDFGKCHFALSGFEIVSEGVSQRSKTQRYIIRGRKRKERHARNTKKIKLHGDEKRGKNREGKKMKDRERGKKCKGESEEGKERRDKMEGLMRERENEHKKRNNFIEKEEQ